MRKEAFLTIDEAGGRDAGKKFRIMEMSAFAAEEWAIRAILALTANGVDIPMDPTEQPSMAQLASIAGKGISLLSGLNFEAAKPLLDEMIDSVEIIMSSGIQRAVMKDAGDIEEIKTIISLRKKWLELHLNFSFGGMPPTSDTSDQPPTNG